MTALTKKTCLISAGTLDPEPGPRPRVRGSPASFTSTARAVEIPKGPMNLYSLMFVGFLDVRDKNSYADLGKYIP